MKDETIVGATVRLPKWLSDDVADKAKRSGSSMNAVVRSYLENWVGSRAMNAPPPSAAPANLIRSLASKSAEVTKALEELAASHGTNKSDLHARAVAATKEGHGIADRLGGRQGGGGKAG